MPRQTPISKALSAAEHPILLTTSAQLADAAREWLGQVVLGIDTEFVRERTYRADLGLIQLSDGKKAWLVDPLSIRSLQPLVEVMMDSRITKVLHSGSEDLEVLLHSLGALPQPMVDTQIACALLGQPLQLAYQNAVSWLFGVTIDKDQTRSNWCRRPLRPGQIRYAALDVVLLPGMLGELKLRLNQKGRWTWLEEEVNRMLKSARRPINPDEVYLRFPGIGKLDDTSLRILRSLAAWREKIASKRNRARGFVISDTALLEMARQRPASAQDLSSIHDLHPQVMKMYRDQLIKLIRTAPEDNSPIAKIEPFNNRQRRALSEMRKLVKQKAAELEIDPALLASRRELERLLRAVRNGTRIPKRFSGWRKTIVGEELLIIAKRETKATT